MSNQNQYQFRLQKLRKTFSQDFIFGKKKEENSETAKDVIFNWNLPKPSRSHHENYDFIAMNKLSAQKGILQREIHNFRNNHVYQKKPKKGTLEMKMKLPTEDFIYGKPVWQNQNMKNVIQYSYQPIQNQKYMDQEEIFQKKKVEIKQTKAGLLIFNKNNKAQEQNKMPFKIKKFQNIPSKIYQKQIKTSIDWKDILDFKQ